MPELLAGEAHLRTFVRVAGVEPTNKEAERTLRNGVIYRKTSGGTGSESSSRFGERLLSVLVTCRRHGGDILDDLMRCYPAL